MRKWFLAPGFLVGLSLVPAVGESPDKPVWPLTLRAALPTQLPGWVASPRDELPDEDENEMGAFVEIGRFFQRIESPTLARQFRVVVQDYKGKDVTESIRRAVAEAKKNTAVETKEFEIGGRKGFAVTDRSAPQPTTLATVIVTPSRLVLGQGANLGGEDAIALLRNVDYGKAASVQREAKR
ncbi:MAG TPA: hypothetical protein VK780_09880 [Thermoanaerobaculia bacterium]|nr:hypothetical protein [Thermoanaerobaculia bacterium]